MLFGETLPHGGEPCCRSRRSPAWSLAGLPLPRAADGRLLLAVDVSNWLRPGPATSPERLFCHVYGRGKGQAQMIPGWPYWVIAALEPGRTPGTAVPDAVRLGPDDDDIAVTAAQVRDVITRLIAAGHWRRGDPDILVLFDAGYDGGAFDGVLVNQRPNVAIVDVRLPPADTDEGLRAALEARRQVPGLPILILSTHVERLYARELLADQASGSATCSRTGCSPTSGSPTRCARWPAAAR